MADIEAAWTALETEAANADGRRIAGLFDEEPGRLDALTFEAAGLWFDHSKQPWSQAGFEAALGLARAANVEAARGRLLSGQTVNITENRAALHTALRAADPSGLSAQGEPVGAEVIAGRKAMQAFAAGVRSGAIAGSGGKPFKAVVHIGIGGSDLGPRLVWEALRPLDGLIDLRFASNVDGFDIAQALHGLDPASTLVVVVSKTFTTQETMANANAARAWLREGLGDDAADRHLAAVSAAPAVAQAFGVKPDRIFGFRDWVGGRFSVWSAVGLSCAVGLGWDAFQGFLDGAAAMDAHFAAAPLERNAPVVLALAHLFNRNGLNRRARAVIPYAQRLRLLPSFLQQLEMESNGKRVSAEGQPLIRHTAPVVFGEPGTNGQHAFFQLLHQGTDVVPVDFIAAEHADEGPAGHQAMLLANCLAQAEALMVGLQGDDIPPHRTFPGDRPSSLILMDRLTPERLGALIALYEHKTFVEGVIWGIDSFDQWGVELGKTLAGRILGELNGGDALPHDPSTAALVTRLRTLG